MNTDTKIKQSSANEVELSSGGSSATQVETPATPRLVVEHIAKAYATRSLLPFSNRTQVLTDASLEVGAGEVVALVGANGSGKSTLMMIIAGMLSRDSGTVAIDGKLGYCPQYPVLYEKLTVAETFRLFGVAYSMDKADIEQRVGELFSELDFASYKNYRVENLSGGTKQKLNLALSLLHDPEILLLDEPYAGFDYETYIRFWTLARSLADRGHSVLIISHFVEDQDRFDRIYRVEGGRCERLS